ncbi:MAG: hypothetical protein WD278_09455, partial [Pirellulales bacterium]
MLRIRHHPGHRHAVPSCLAAWALLAAGTSAGADESDPIKAAQTYRRSGQPVAAQSDATLIAEAEEFQVSQPGWQARPWGTNYYAATFANSFLSRKAYLGAPEQCDRSAATIEVQVPAAGRYLALVRYEAAYRFETQFRVEIEQNGKMVLDRLYGARDNVKIWAFGEKLKKEHAWPWGAVENMVWEGHDAHVNLEAGTARLTLVADRQPDNAARRNVDLVMLCGDAEQVARRIESESYLPLDGMLTQAGDLYLKLRNDPGGGQTTLTVNPGGEHSPYWVHLRNWQPKTLSAGPGESTEWVEVGSLLDSLNDGQWSLNPKGTGTLKFALEFGLRGPDGRIETIRRLDNQTGDVALAYDADTRYTRRVRTAGEILHGLLDYLKAQPVTGTAPQRTLVYGYTFDRREGDAKYNAAIDEFRRLFGLAATQQGNGGVGRNMPSGYIDVRGVPTAKLEDYCRNLHAEGKADQIAVVSLGDEIGLPAPPAGDDAGFRAWLGGQNVPAGTDPSTLSYDPDPKAAGGNPVQFYLSRRYARHYGILALKQRTEILQKHLPNAGIGANYSPHHHHAYLGEVAQWVTTFREGGMTQPWSEDYIWQLPVGSQQMNFINLDLLRAGMRGKPHLKIHYYVMPHWPGNTPNSWRRQFYGDIAHGMK